MTVNFEFLIEGIDWMSKYGKVDENHSLDTRGFIPAGVHKLAERHSELDTIFELNH